MAHDEVGLHMIADLVKELAYLFLCRYTPVQYRKAFPQVSPALPIGPGPTQPQVLRIFRSMTIPPSGLKMQ